MPGLGGCPENAETLSRTNGPGPTLLTQQGLQMLGHEKKVPVSDNLSALGPVWVCVWPPPRSLKSP